MRLLYLHGQAIDTWEANVIQVLHMCCAFSESGVKVTLAVPGRIGDEKQILDAARNQIGKNVCFAVRPYRKFTLCGRFSMVGGYREAGCMLRAERTDYCFTRNPVYLNAALKHGIPTIFESHDATIHNNAPWNALWTRNLIRNSHHRQFIKFIAISHRLADEWTARGIPPDKVVILHDGVDIDSFHLVSGQAAVRKQLDLPPGKKIVLYTGSLFADRGVERILDLARYFRNASFVIVGGPEERTKYYADEARKQRLPNITMVGRIAHHKVKEYLTAADVLLMIWSSKVRTINYCSPLKMFEYMAAGRIIVGDAFPTIREVLTDGKNALLADPNSFCDLKDKLSQALDYAYPNAIAASAKRLAFERYSWKSRAEAILNSIGVKRCTL